MSRIEVLELSIVYVPTSYQLYHTDCFGIRGRHVDLLNSFILAMDFIIQTDTEHRSLTFLIFYELKS